MGSSQDFAFFRTHFEIGIPQIQGHKSRQPETVGIELFAGFECGCGKAAHFGVNQLGQPGHIQQPVHFAVNTAAPVLDDAQIQQTGTRFLIAAPGHTQLCFQMLGGLVNPPAAFAVIRLLFRPFRPME